MIIIHSEELFLLEFTLIDNGADSLKKARQCIESFNENEEQFSYHFIKDATIFLNHSIELLLKHILSSKNESLIFRNLNKYTEAKKQLIHKYDGPVRVENGFGFYPSSKYTVFDVPKAKGLETISLSEAIDRIKYFCDINMSDKFIGAIYYVNDYRNKIMHHSIKIFPGETREYINRLKFLYDEALDFFDVNIPGILEKVDHQRYEIRKEEWEQMQADMEDYYHERAMSKIL